MTVEDTGTKFVLREADGVARLRYRLEGDRLVLEHTMVPDELGGRGIGSSLVQAAVERARADGLSLVAECRFASAWLRRHANDVADLNVEHKPIN
jgi:predicted GNAT family acetyltransferase